MDGNDFGYIQLTGGIPRNSAERTREGKESGLAGQERP